MTLKSVIWFPRMDVKEADILGLRQRSIIIPRKAGVRPIFSVRFLAALSFTMFGPFSEPYMEKISCEDEDIDGPRYRLD